MKNNIDILQVVYFQNGLSYIFVLLVLWPLALIIEPLLLGSYIYLFIPILTGLLYYGMVLFVFRHGYLYKWYWRLVFVFEGVAIAIACFKNWIIQAPQSESLPWVDAFLILMTINVLADYDYRKSEWIEE